MIIVIRRYAKHMFDNVNIKYLGKHDNEDD